MNITYAKLYGTKTVIRPKCYDHSIQMGEFGVEISSQEPQQGIQANKEIV